MSGINKYQWEPFSLVDAPGPCAIIFSQGCNLSCKYCYNINLRNFDSYGFLLEEILIKIQKLSKISPKGINYNIVDWLILSGGEPFPRIDNTLGFQINENAIKILTLAKNQGIQTGVYTSGLSPFIREALDKNLVDFLNIDYKHYDIKYIETNSSIIWNYLFDLNENIRYAYEKYLDYNLKYFYLNTVICKSIHTQDTLLKMKKNLFSINVDIPIYLKRDYSKNFGWILTSFFNDNNKIPTLGNLTTEESLSEQELKLLI